MSVARKGGEKGWPIVALEQYKPIERLRSLPRYKERLTEISFNGPGDVQVRVAGIGYVQLPAHDAAFCTEAWFASLCAYFAAAHNVAWSPEMPLVACRTPDGDRFIGIVGANVESGFAGSIRVKRMKHVEYADFGIGPREAEMISTMMADGKNIFLSGGTGSGKTTLFNRMCRDIPKHHRVVTAEDTRELVIDVPNKVHFIVSRTEAQTRIRYNEITDTTLRLNPDRYIFGELSIQNAFALVQALDTGHEGAGTTGHANSAYDFMRGMRRRVALGGGLAGAEIDDMLDFIADNVHLIMQVKHMPTAAHTERRVVTEIAVPKDLLNARRRGEIAERMRHDDKVVDLGLARELLLKANAGAPLSAAQNEVLRTLALLGVFKAPGAAPPATNDRAVRPDGDDETGDARILSPEEQFALAGRRFPLAAEPADGGLAAETHGSFSRELQGKDLPQAVRRAAGAD